MPSADQTVRTYRELAEDYGRQGQAQMRDRFLVLAADAALAAGQEDEAERLRGRLLQHNPHHLLKPYSSFGEAMKSTDVQNYVSALRRNHPYEKAENLLEGLRQTEQRSPAEETRIKGGTPPRSTARSEIDPATGKEASEPREDLKVFRLMEAGEPGAHTKPLSPSTSPPAARPGQSPQPPSPARSAGAPNIFPLRREPYPVDMSRATPPDNRDPNAGAWVSTILFVLVLVAGIVLAVYTLIRPFLPQGWF